MSHEPRAKRRRIAGNDGQAVFRCQHAGCASAYRRKEHLNRHAQQHTREPRYSCNYCSRKFFRRDILRRHLELHDEDIELTRSRTTKACDVCRSRKSRCDGNAPCRTCSERGIACIYSQAGAPHPRHHRHHGHNPAPPAAQEPSPANTENQPTPRALQPQQPPDRPTIAALSYCTQDILLDASMLIPDHFSLDPDDESSSSSTAGGHAWANFPNLACIRRHVDAYWRVFHPKWLFLHKASFRLETEPPILLLSMVTASLWVQGGADQRTVALDLHRRLMVMLYQQRPKWDVPATSAPWPLATFQGILIHLVLATCYALPTHHPPSAATAVSTAASAASAASTRILLLRDLLRPCRRLRLFSHAAMLAQFGGAELGLVTWTRVEEVKRFAVVLWRVCECVGQDAVVGGVDDDAVAADAKGRRGGGGGAAEDEEEGEEVDRLLSSSELRFQPPEPDEVWTAEGIRELLVRREECGLGGGRRREDEQEEAGWICNVVGRGRGKE